MSFVDELPNFIAPATVRVLEGRAELLRRLALMLKTHAVPFAFDDSRFQQDRLYAACTLHAQRQVIDLLERATRTEIDLEEVRARASRLLGRPELGPLLFVDRNQLDSLLAGEPVPTEPAAIAALLWLEQSELRAQVESGASLALLGRRITQDQGVRNHSDEFHLFTVNVDVVLDNPVKTAEALVHEASHNILNVFLEDRQIILQDNPLAWHSPWTNSLRHHRGIVHGFFAFALVVAFYQRLEIPDFQADVDRYAGLQAQHLRTVLPSLRAILPHYPAELQAFIEETYACVV